ncbi:MAG: hypothetical protein WB509_15660, partial [Acetobacteraceae bacterium]
MASEQITITAGPPASEVVEIWTDGGCKPNPGPGGWGAILRFRGRLAGQSLYSGRLRHERRALFVVVAEMAQKHGAG